MGGGRWPARVLALLSGFALAASALPLSTARADEADGLTQEESESAAALEAEVQRLVALGRYVDATPKVKELGFIRELQSRNLLSAANNFIDLGNFEEAIRLLERTLALREKLYGPEHDEATFVLEKLGLNVMHVGDYRRAQALFERLLAIREKAPSEYDTQPLIRALHDLAALALQMGDYRRAAGLFERIVAMRDLEDGAGVEDDVAALSALADAYFMQRDFARAEPVYMRALGLAEREAAQLEGLNKASADAAAEERRRSGEEAVTGEGRIEFTLHAGCLVRLAKLYREKGDFARAAPLYERALSIYERADGAGSGNVAFVLNHMGLLAKKQGDLARAQGYFERAREIRERLSGAGSAETAPVLANLAGVAMLKGELARAKELYEGALKGFEASLGKEHLNVAVLRSYLGMVAMAQGKVAEAVESEAKAVAIRDRVAALLLAGGSEQQKTAYMVRMQTFTGLTVSLHAHSAPTDAQAARLALSTILTHKGRVLDAMSDSFAALRRRADPESQGLFDRLAQVSSRLAAQVSRGPGDLSMEEHQANLRKLEGEREALEEQVSRRSASFQAYPRAVSIDEVQAAIAEDAALVELFVYEPYEPGGSKPGERAQEPRYVAYVLRHRGAVRSVDLGEAAAVDAAVDRLRDALADPTRDPGPPARALDERIMRPVRALIGDARRILMSPDGGCNLVPFGALRDEEGRHLIERFSFTYLTSGRDILRFNAPRAPRQGALVLANPAFGDLRAKARARAGAGAGDRGSSAESREQRGEALELMALVKFTPLPGTAEEARGIGQQLAGAEVLTGAAATESRLKAVHGPRILHIATHGFFLPEKKPPKSALAQARGLDIEALAAAGPSIDNPLLRAGLAFSGANARESGADDGVLTALEASALDLDGTKLVVLSACETGVGETTKGDGVRGLRRALGIAGAETQVMSLWKVDDDATRDLMVGYYGRLRAGAGRSEAMREVQLAMLARKATAHPYYWASFIVSGNGAPLPEAAVVRGQVEPGSRGCACVTAGDERGGGARASVTLGLAWVAAAVRRKRRRRE